ncbi:UcrQ family-domain-containing protein [Terfezia claveryi]|nr:UcrQ family-domain-containing protein [Terfezia claveryi]
MVGQPWYVHLHRAVHLIQPKIPLRPQRGWGRGIYTTHLTGLTSPSTGSLPQKGITTYALSPNRQKPLAGTAHAAVFNSFRRFRQSVLYVVPPFIVGYMLMDWATKRNEFLNSKEGRALYSETE